MKHIRLENINPNEITAACAAKMAIFHNGQVFTFWDMGTSRAVFVNKDMTKVLKMNKSELSDHNYNEDEYNIYINADDEDRQKMCATRLLERGFIEQEFVTPIKWGGKKLTKNQQEFSNSCRGEVGWDKNGKLVCYDLDEYEKY